MNSLSPDPSPARPPHVGRFAPSPTGALHFGSLLAALSSCLDARANGGQWHVRIEDVDTPRTVPGAAAAILSTLERYGFEWDGEIVHQSTRIPVYRAALAALQASGAVFPCGCSRRELELASSAHARDGSRRYPGTCRNGLAPDRAPRAWRVRATGRICFDDAIQGRQCETLEQDSGDYVVLRADGLFAYQLAVVVDDAEAGITHVVRGADLLDSTARQLHLQTLLGFPHPSYAHVPVASNTAGEKLSKQTRATAIDDHAPVPVLLAALRFLGQNPPLDDLQAAPLAETWKWAFANWKLSAIPRCPRIPAPDFC